jgi:NAD(P)-dependent dehydrogenase (short-subunit alcohol dehydrogenase family)
MEQIFQGKTALVTGAASGIGKAAALLYARKGAQVVVSDVNEAGGQETAAAIRQAGGTAFFVRADVSQSAACESLIQQAIQQYGRLDIAFNNAGISGEQNMAGDLSIEGWNKVIAVNLSSVFYCMKYELAALLQSGGGAIVNMSSILGQVAFPYAAAYVSAKHGVVGLTRTAGVEYATRNIRINAIGPAFIDTPLLGALDASTKAAVVLKHPIGRLGTSEEVAELVIWLSSPAASFVTGSYYSIDGGYLAV